MWLAADTICPPDGYAPQVELELDLGISSAFGLLDFLLKMYARQHPLCFVDYRIFYTLELLRIHCSLL